MIFTSNKGSSKKTKRIWMWYKNCDILLLISFLDFFVMDILIIPIFNCILVALNIYQYAIMAYIILGWLELFKLVNPYSNVIYSIHNFLFSIVEPALIQIRRFLPSGMVIDVSPFILVLSIYFIQDVIGRLIGKVIG